MIEDEEEESLILRRGSSFKRKMGESSDAPNTPMKSQREEEPVYEPFPPPKKSKVSETVDLTTDEPQVCTNFHPNS